MGLEVIEACLKMRQYLCRVFYGITYCYAFSRVQTLRRNTSNPVTLCALVKYVVIVLILRAISPQTADKNLPVCYKAS